MANTNNEKIHPKAKPARIKIYQNRYQAASKLPATQAMWNLKWWPYFLIALGLALVVINIIKITDGNFLHNNSLPRRVVPGISLIAGTVFIFFGIKLLFNKKAKESSTKSR
jgi:putative Ca2+/H+ antiporter (TMEM165/GDT1 family)